MMTAKQCAGRFLAGAIFRWVLVWWIAAVPVADGSTGAVSASAPDLRGIYVFSNDIGGLSSATATKLTAALAVPGVDGLVIDVGWSTLEPAKGQYDWTLLDQWLVKAAQLGKKISLAVTAGDNTPAWLFQAAPAGGGATPLGFTISPHNGATGSCVPVTLAAPWDPAFLGRWDALLAALAGHLQGTGQYGRVAMLRLTGINRTSEELRLPAETAQNTGLACVTDAIALWQQAGYRPAKLLQGWDAITASFQKSFPDKSFSVAIIPSNAFPRIASDGSVITGTVPDQNLPLLTLASQRFPGHLVVQFDFLMPGEAASPAVIQAAQTLGTLAAFQTNEYLGATGGQGAACSEPVTNPTPCTATTFLELLQTGIYPLGKADPLRAQYIEVFQANASAFPDDIVQAHNALFAGSGTPATPVVVEYYDPDLDNFFITADPTEQAFVDTAAVGRWLRTGNTFAAGGPGPVCRFYGNSNTDPATGRIYGPNSHFYTASASECAGLKAQYVANAKSWKFESNDFLTTPAAAGACPAGLVPVFRAYNNGFTKGIDSNHRITSNYAAYQQTVAAGWTGEGVVMCAPSVPKIAGISVCSPTGKGGSGSCPAGTFDTHQIVLAPDGSGTAINAYGVGATTDEHASVFSPGTLGSNNDYLFFVASGVKTHLDIGAAVLSGGTGPNASGQWTFDYPLADGYGVYSATSFSTVFVAPTPQSQCIPAPGGNAANQDPTFDLNYAAPGSVVNDPTAPAGSILMIYEGTNTCIGNAGGPKTGDGAYITTAVATSLDYGKTWPTYAANANFAFVPLPEVNHSQGPRAPAGAVGAAACTGNDCTHAPPPAYGRYPALSPSIPLTARMQAAQSLGNNNVSNGEPSAFVDDASGDVFPYLYVVYGYNPGAGDPPLSNGAPSDLMLARARLNGGTAPLAFAKWDGKAFAAQGIGGTGEVLLPMGSYTNCGANAQSRHMGSISYVETTRQYLLLFVCTSPGDPALGHGDGGGSGTAWFYATSDDLSTPAAWSLPLEITGSWSRWDNSQGCADYKGWYPTAMSLGARPGHLSTTGHIVYLWGCVGGSSTGSPPKRQYSSRAFSITTQP